MNGIGKGNSCSDESSLLLLPLLGQMKSVGNFMKLGLVGKPEGSDYIVG